MSHDSTRLLVEMCEMAKTVQGLWIWYHRVCAGYLESMTFTDLKRYLVKTLGRISMQTGTNLE